MDPGDARPAARGAPQEGGAHRLPPGVGGVRADPVRDADGGHPDPEVHSQTGARKYAEYILNLINHVPIPRSELVAQW